MPKLRDADATRVVVAQETLLRACVMVAGEGYSQYIVGITHRKHWKCVKVYMKAYANAPEARRELSHYFRFYNDRRPHQALGYRTPAEVFHEARNATGDRSNVTESSPERVWVSLAGAAGLSLNSTSVLSK